MRSFLSIEFRGMFGEPQGDSIAVPEPLRLQRCVHFLGMPKGHGTLGGGSVATSTVRRVCFGVPDSSHTPKHWTVV